MQTIFWANVLTIVVWVAVVTLFFYYRSVAIKERQQRERSRRKLEAAGQNVWPA